jgi:hypothetical protein
VDVPEGHTQLPFEQTKPEAQTFPQDPQLLTSPVSSVQADPQTELEAVLHW